jgi:hypothetical protein
MDDIIEEEYPKILIDKKSIKFIKNNKNIYNINFSLENKNILLYKIIDIDLIKVLYDLNVDIYEKVSIEKISDHEAIIKLLFRSLFEDCGIPQIYSYLNVKKVVKNDKINFFSMSIIEKPNDIGEDVILFNMNRMDTSCRIINENKIDIIIDININESIDIPPIIEKLIGNIFIKLISRFKLFIEKIQSCSFSPA